MFELARKTLKLERDAGPEEVRRAYVRLVRRYPPEHFPEKFVALRRAYQQLTLDDDFIEELSPQLMANPDALTLARLMWGDREELRPEKGASLTDLLSSLDGAPRTGKKF